MASILGTGSIAEGGTVTEVAGRWVSRQTVHSRLARYEAAGLLSILLTPC
jgi:hypothetical protein